MKILKYSLLSLLVASCFSGAAAAPTLPQVVNGQATFSQQGNVFSITNTPNTIINWQSFSVNAGEITRFIQQNENSAVLNRILGQDPSQILGALQSNGRVFLINPNGILFGRDSRVDVNGLVASTLNLSNADFLAGKKNFAAGASAGNVSNQGAITTASGGQVFLIAPNVENSGVITSPKGEVVLAAGHTVQLVDSANPDLHVVVSAPASQAINLGQVIAQGGKVGIYGALVNQRGVVNANSAVVGENGKIVFKASGDTLLEAGSVTSATGAGKGGEIQILGERVGLTGNAQVDASGNAGGGMVLVGGDYQGKNSAIPNAQQAFLGKDVTINADAHDSGDGGKVVVWSDGITRAYGSISARGGASGGNGGFVETSGHVLDMQGIADTRAPKGKTGTLLLDPTNIYIATNLGSAGVSGLSDIIANLFPFSIMPGVADSLLPVAALELQLALSNVNVSTVSSGGGSGNITVVNPVSWGLGHTLNLRADGGIAVNAALSGANGDLVLRAYGGNITQSAAITAGSLLAYADVGTVSLTNAANAVGTLAGYSGASGAGFSFANSTDLIVGVASGSHGVWSNQGPLTLTAVGNLTVNDLTYGIQSLGGVLNMNAAGGLLQIAGPVTTAGAPATLMGTTGITLTSTSAVTTTGGLTLHTDGTLETNAAVSANSLLLEASKMKLNSGTISAASISLQNPNGPINLGSATDLGAGIELSGAELGKFSTGSLSIITAYDIDVTGASVLTPAGVSTLNLLNANNISVAAGSGLHPNSGLYLTASNKITNAGTLQATDVGLTAPKMALAGGSIIGLSDVQLYSAGRHAWLGTDATDLDATALELSSLELNTVSAPLLRIVTTGGQNIVVKGALSNGASGAFEHLTGTSTLGLWAPGGGISQASDAPIGGVNQLSLNGGYVDMRAANPTGVVSGVSASDFLFQSTNQISVGYVDGVHGITAATGSGNDVVMLTSTTSGINQLSGSPITIPGGWLALSAAKEVTLNESDNNFRYLTGSMNFGTGTRATTSIYNSGDLTIGSQIFFDQHYTGIDNGNQNLQVKAGAGTLMVNAPIITTGSGAVTLTAGAAASPTVTNVVAFEAAVTAPGGLTVNAHHVSGSLAPPAGPAVTLNLYGAAPPPTLAACIANPNLSGCSAVLPSLATCVDAPATAGCGVVLPGLSSCIGAPTTAGCEVVLPDLSSCIGAPTTAGCAVVLPTLASCTGAPATAGCSVVLPSLAACVSAPTTAGCSAVLPSIAACTVSPTAPGCSVVLPPMALCITAPTTAGCLAVLPTLTACIAAPTSEGCSVVLPSLPSCVFTPTAQGCSVVLPPMAVCITRPTAVGCSVVLPTLAICIGSPNSPGCSVVLPTMTACIAAPTTAGCTVVLPTLPQCVVTPTAAGCTVVLPSLAACITTPSTQGCSVVLPTLSQCIATSTQAGCTVVLPTLSQCTASPTLQGCTVVLPTLAQCAAAPTQAGCTAVLPTASFCSTHPADAACVAIAPPSAPQEGEGANPIGQAINTTVNIINTTTTKVTTTTTTGGGASGSTASSETKAGTDTKKDDKKADGTVASNDKLGAKNEPTKKMYCN